MTKTQTKDLICYYKAMSTLEVKRSGVSSYVTTKPLYSDETLKHKIGFTKATIEFIPQNANVLATVEASFFINKRIFTCSYVKRNSEEITTLITYSNVNSKNDAYLGKITREILSDGNTRKVTISAIKN